LIQTLSKMGKSKIFIVEDDLFYSKLIQHKISMDPDFEVRIFNSGQSLLDNLHENPQVISLDHSLPDYTGLELLPIIQKYSPNSQVIVLSAQNDVHTALKLMKAGAYDYLIKDNEAIEKLWLLVHKANERSVLELELKDLTMEVSSKYNFKDYITGNSDSMQVVFDLLKKTSQTKINVIVSGETGTGKELIAKAIHFNSSRMKKPFVSINMAAIPKELIESELFGYEKGAFTGAEKSKSGKFEDAHNGTLFLDEIGEMDLNSQSKLLRVLQEREVTRLGSNKTIAIDVRIVVATHKNLYQEVKEGRFREDLFYRLMGLQITLPPLRDRGSDIIILATKFIKDFCSENEIEIKALSKDAQHKIASYPYPGNVRQLKSIVEIAVVMSDEKIIHANDINFNESEKLYDMFIGEKTLEAYTEIIIHYYLKKYDNNVIKVSEILDIGKSTIYNMLKKSRTIGESMHYDFSEGNSNKMLVVA
jgi:DNA-binding NtrC family response regulator